MPFELKPIESESLFIECFEHGVSGLGEWSEMVDGMLSAVRICPSPSFSAPQNSTFDMLIVTIITCRKLPLPTFLLSKSSFSALLANSVP